MVARQFFTERKKGTDSPDVHRDRLRQLREWRAGDCPRFWRPAERYHYYYNTGLGLRSLGGAGWQVLEVRETNRTNNTYKQYVWGVNYIDAPVVRFRDSADDTTLDEALYYTYDAQFNVTALIDATAGSGTRGEVVERYVYDPYGKATRYDDDWSATVSWSSSKQNELLYCGYRHDPESEFYHVRHRYYHPTLGRWATRDPAGYVDGGSMYVYCWSAPTCWVDAYGTTATQPTTQPTTQPSPLPSIDNQTSWKESPLGKEVVVTGGTVTLNDCGNIDVDDWTNPKHPLKAEVEGVVSTKEKPCYEITTVILHGQFTVLVKRQYLEFWNKKHPKEQYTEEQIRNHEVMHYTSWLNGVKKAIRKAKKEDWRTDETGKTDIAAFKRKVEAKITNYMKKRWEEEDTHPGEDWKRFWADPANMPSSQPTSAPASQPASHPASQGV